MKAQISFEYILIITIAMMILLPGAYLFRNYAIESNDKIMERRLAEVSSQIFLKGREMFYYGPPSRSVISLEMPSQVENAYILQMPDEYYLVFIVTTSKGTSTFYYESEVPLDSDEPECTPSDECSSNICKCMIERFYSSGIKNIEVKADESCSGGLLSCIKIAEISDELQ